MAQTGFFKAFRISILLLVLLFVAFGTWLGNYRATSWDEALHVSIYVINADGEDSTQRYIEDLDDDTFGDIEDFIAEEAARYDIDIDKPMEITLAEELDVEPPAPPRGGNVVQIMFWSLKLRWWAWRNSPGVPADIRMYVMYYDPAFRDTVAHSLGLQKGRIGVVHAFSARRMTASNNFVIMHELLHTLGATDKYDFRNNYPAWPGGFAEPDLDPVVPQEWAEIMGGRRPISDDEAVQPESLNEALIGESTAQELRWLD